MRGSEIIAVLFENLRSALAVGKYRVARSDSLLNPKSISKICLCGGKIWRSYPSSPSFSPKVIARSIFWYLLSFLRSR